jgi:tRNA A-37 threonylcarbamoyl transferase component Bud32
MAKHGRYKIVRRVADGGMAEIFLATQLGRDGFQKPVILKRIHSTIYADPQFRNMFIDEAHISMSLAHSNIVQVLDLGVAAGRYFLVLEMVDGWDMGRVMQRAATAGMPLPRELGLYITANVCRALAYAHGKTDGQRALGIVHRDISPHNVLLSEQGEVKLTDFGIAKAMNKREHTGTGVVKGKVAFMSPEQAMGKPIDARSDLFSLGTVLYLLMTRTRPFEGPTDLETLLRVQKGDFAPPEATAPDLEPEVAAIINRAMRHDPADRYQNADEMLTDLERVSRTVFHPVGQSELKRWLAELAEHDGIGPITKVTGKTGGSRTGTGELDGKDVVLADTDEEEIVDGEAVTGLAVVEGGANGRVRLSRQRPTHALLPVPQDAEAEQSGRAARVDFVLPVPEGEEPPGRRRARRGGSWVTRLFVVAVLLGGAYLGGKYYRVWSDLGFGGGEGHGTATAGESEPKAEAKAETKAETKAEKKSAKEAKHDTPKPVAGGGPDASARDDNKNDKGDKNDNDGEEKGAAHRATESGAARESGSKRKRERHAGPDLKSLMAPDPSLLPAPTPPALPPAPEPAPENP